MNVRKTATKMGYGTGVLLVLMAMSVAIVYAFLVVLSNIPQIIIDVGGVTLLLGCLVIVVWMLGDMIVEDSN